MVFVPAETQRPGGCAGSRQRSSEFRQLLCVLCWKVGTVLGLGSISESSIRPEVLRSGGLLGLLIYTCRESGWDLFHCGTAAIGTGGSSGAGRWRKGRWVLGGSFPSVQCWALCPLPATLQDQRVRLQCWPRRKEQTPQNTAGSGTSQMLVRRLWGKQLELF